jgi:hypothetical protein
MRRQYATRLPPPTAARADRNALLARVPDEVPDDQEVPGYFIFLIISSS